MTERDPSQPACGDSLLQSLLQTAPVAVIAADPEHRITLANEAAARLLGTPAEQLRDRPVFDFIPSHHRKLLRRLMEKVGETGGREHFEARLPNLPDGQRDLLVMLSPLGDADSPDGTVLWILDQTESRRLAEQIAQREKMSSLSILAGGIAHHINNILGGMTTSVDYALTSGDTVAMKRALNVAADAASRTSKITQSLLSYAELDQHGQDLADLTEVVLTFAHLVEQPLAQHEIALKLDLEPVPIMEIEASRMHQVLGNLLTNAEEAISNGGGTIEIGLRREGDEVLVSFSDTGCGIPKKNLPLVFEPFFTTKGLLAGGDQTNPGLGLSVVHGIVLEMGGRIEVDSQLGTGTTFTIALPVPPDKRAEEPPVNAGER